MALEAEQQIRDRLVVSLTGVSDIAAALTVAQPVDPASLTALAAGAVEASAAVVASMEVDVVDPTTIPQAVSGLIRDLPVPELEAGWDRAAQALDRCRLDLSATTGLEQPLDPGSFGALMGPQLDVALTDLLGWATTRTHLLELISYGFPPNIFRQIIPGWLREVDARLLDLAAQATVAAAVADSRALLVSGLAAGLKRATTLAATAHRVGRLLGEGVPGVQAEVARALTDIADLTATAWPGPLPPEGTYTRPPAELARTARLGELRAATGRLLAGSTGASDALPAVLLPVRLESTFVWEDDGTLLLRVRVFPDSVSVTSHVPTLTADEQVWAEALQQLPALPDSDSAARWSRAADLFGDTRAAYLRHAPRTEIDAPARTALWDRPAVVHLAPTRWLVAAYDSTGALLTAALGADAITPLQVSPDPTAGPPAPGAVVEDGLRWLVDYPTAEAMGWAVTLRLDPGTATATSRPVGSAPPGPATRRAEVARVVVTGVGPADAAGGLADLLAGHRFTDGMELVTPGTPTNNTPQVPSGYSTREAGHRHSFELEVLDVAASAPLPGPGAGADDTTRLAAALGVPADTFAAVGRKRTDAVDAQAIATVAWPVTWAGFLAMATEATPEMVEGLRRWATSWVRPLGPLATVRLGNQPYGLLPVVSVAGFADLPDAPSANPVGEHVARVVDRLLPTWVDAADAELAALTLDDVLTRGPVSRDAGMRVAVAPIGDGEVGSWFSANQALMGLSFAEVNRAGDSVVSRQDDRVAATDVLLGTAATIRLPQQLAVFPIDTSPPFSLTVPGPFAGTGDDVVADGGRLDALGVLATTGQLPSDAVTPTLLTELATRAWATTGAGPVDAAVELTVRGRISDVDPAVPAESADLPPALIWLASRNAADVGRQLGATLDAASHRVDAWATSLATYRLAQLRQSAGPEGVTVGGYGWVEDLVERGPSTPAGDPALGSDVVVDSGNAGFVHAPSPGQAVTAAVLRSGYLAHNPVPGTAGPSAPFAIDLSSRRARLAVSVLDGVRQGQELSALLGQRFERTLVDGGQGQFVAYFRSIAPADPAANQVPVWPGDGAPAPVAGVQPADVVDGVTLHQLWTSRPTGQASPGSAAWDAAGDALAELADTLDAVADAVTATALHETLAGNTSAAAATLDAVATGTVAADARSFLATPRTGQHLVHRILIAAGAGSTAGWPQTPRTLAEPMLSGWVAGLLGDPANASATVTLVVAGPPPGSPSVTESVEVSLAQLGVGPLDLLDLVDRPGELERLGVDAAVAARPADAPPVVRGTLQPVADGALRPLGWVLDLAAALGAAIGAARSGDARDLAVPGAAADPGVDLSDLTTRVAAADASLTAAAEAVAALFPGVDLAAVQVGPGTPVDPVTTRAALRQAFLLGVPGSVPEGATRDRFALTTQARTVWAELSRRRATFDAVTGTPAGAAPGQELTVGLDRLRAVFGRAFPATGTLTTAALPDVTDGYPSVTAEPAGQDPLAWVTRQGLVRPAVSHLLDALTGAEALGGKELQVTIAQVPARPGAHWAGQRGDERPVDGTTCLVFVGGSRPTAPFSLLVLSESTELLPNPTETTALTYPFVSPDAQAPQAILLAVPATLPTQTTSWTHAGLLDVVNETVRLSHARSVDSTDVLGPLGAVLPAAYLADALYDEPAVPAAVPPGFLHPAGHPTITGVTVDGAPATAFRPGSTHVVQLSGDLFVAEPPVLFAVVPEAGGNLVITGQVVLSGSQATVDIAVPEQLGPLSFGLRGGDGPVLPGALTVAGPSLDSVDPAAIGQGMSAREVTITVTGVGLSDAAATLSNAAALSGFTVTSRAQTSMTAVVTVAASDYEPGDTTIEFDDRGHPIHREPTEARHVSQTLTLSVTPAGRAPMNAALTLDLIV